MLGAFSYSFSPLISFEILAAYYMILNTRVRRVSNQKRLAYYLAWRTNKIESIKEKRMIRIQRSNMITVLGVLPTLNI